jgi:CHAT domain-containing protein
LIIVPDGPLHRLPFDALVLADGKLLLERYAVALAPSSRLASSWWATSTPTEARPVLAFGGARFGQDTGLAPLPASVQEARAIARGAARGEVRLGAQASEAGLKREALQRFGIVHFATHARVEDKGVMSSALFLSPGNGDDGRVGVEEIAALSLDDALVVLSACRTVGGAIVSGEGLQGLTAPFLEAGARAVVATHWPIGDRSIVPLMQSFYDALRAGRPAGEALRAARLAAVRDGATPTLWAALTLTGDAALQPALR